VKSTFAIFFSIILLIYFSINLYVYNRSAIAFQGQPIRTIFIVLFWMLVLAYPVGRILESTLQAYSPTFVVKLGSLWLATMVYLILGFLAFDLLRVIYHFTGLSFLSFVKENRNVTVAITYAVALVTVVAGYINAANPAITRLTIPVEKPRELAHPLKLVAVSDVHLGTIIANGRLSRMVKLINAQDPDIILLVGDTFDEDLGPVIRNNMGQQLQMLRSKMGIFAVTGNHEYYGNPTVAVKYLEDHGIKVLQDTTVVVGGLVNLIGRNDRQSISMLHKQRKPLDELVKEANPKLPIVLMDHQPFHLEEAEQNGVTLQLSGHTHHGQMWPFGYITKAIFEVSRGFYKKGNTSYYVSTGYGTWGPPVRTGNRPEVVVITLE